MSEKSRRTSAIALRFVLLIGVMSFFADFTYEGARSIIGPYLGTLGAGAFVISAVIGFGELLGYGLRLVSGRLSDKFQRFWPVAIFGYIVQMAPVPLLALAGSWQAAAGLILLERIGKATRNPPRDVMLSHAAKEMGYGWGFGIHEALDQFGALFGPLVVAAVLARSGHYQLACAVLLIPALITLSILAAARLIYPQPEHLESNPPSIQPTGLPHVFWMYLAGTALVGTGFADFPLIAYHFAHLALVPATFVPVFYAVAMGVSGSGSLLFGRLFDHAGLLVLIPPTLLSALFAPLVFLGNFWVALIGIALWGLGIGVHESIVPAAVTPMVDAPHRASAYGLFTAVYGIFWFLGSVLIGVLYNVSVPVLVTFSLVTELLALPFFFIAWRQSRAIAPRG
jgi:predicted MFS family arabinose efflux permease